MIGTVNLGMTVCASPVENESRGGRLRSGRMPAGVVALLAEPRRLRFQQLRVAGAVSFVAIEAVLHHRRMLPKERPSALGMALIARRVDGSFDQQLRIGSAMHVMAVGARD